MTRPVKLSDRLCACGCGRRTPLVTHTDARRGARKGDPRRYCQGHNRKTGGPRPKPVESQGYRRTRYRADELLDEWVFLRDFCTWQHFPARAGIGAHAWEAHWTRAKRAGDPRAQLGAADLDPTSMPRGTLRLPVGHGASGVTA